MILEFIAIIDFDFNCLNKYEILISFRFLNGWSFNLNQLNYNQYKSTYDIVKLRLSCQILYCYNFDNSNPSYPYYYKSDLDTF